MATDKELKSQTDLTNGLTAALEKLYGAMDRVATNSASQTQALLNFNDSMTNMSKNTGPAIENLESLNEAAVQASDTFDNRLTKSVDSLADVMHKRRKSFEKFEENLRMTKDIASILTNPLGKIIKTIPGMGKLGSAIGGVTKNTYNLFKEIQMSTSVMGKFALGAKALGSILGAGVSLGIGAVNLGLKMFTGSLSLATSAVKGFISFATNIVTSIKDIAFGIVKTVFTIPMQIASVAADIGGKLRKIIVEEIGNASEDSKRLFDHTSDVGKAVASIRQQAISLIPAFTSVRSEATKLFGDNQNYIKKTQEAVDSLGQFADIYGAQIARGTKEAFMFERASQVLGLTAQDNLYLVGEAAKNGESIYEAVQRRTDAMESVSKEFGLDRKRLSTNFNKLRVDIQNFAHISDPELGRVVARATELGLEAKGLTSIFNKFTTFEGAAQSAAQLSQAFGMNVDALDLIRAKDPMEIVYMFRDAMFQTGRSFDDLNRHEKGLLASQTGMSQEQLKMAMNFATAGKSMEETRKAMAAATPEARQIKMFKNMNSSIKEFKKTLQFGSLFDAVTAGFKGMIANNKDVQKSFGLFSKGYEGIYEYMLELGKDKEIQKGLLALGKTVSKIGALLGGKEMKKTLKEGIKLIGNFISYVLFEFNRCRNDVKQINPFGKPIEEGFNEILAPNGPVMTIVGGLWKIGVVIAKKMLMGFLRIFPGIAINMLELVKTGVNGIISFLGSGECSTDFRASFSKLVGCEDEGEVNNIVKSWKGLFKRIGNEASKGGLFDTEDGPFAKIFYWFECKFKQIAKNFGETIVEFLALDTGRLGGFLFSNEKIEEMTQKRAKREAADKKKALKMTMSSQIPVEKLETPVENKYATLEGKIKEVNKKVDKAAELYATDTAFGGQDAEFMKLAPRLKQDLLDINKDLKALQGSLTSTMRSGTEQERGEASTQFNKLNASLLNNERKIRELDKYTETKKESQSNWKEGIKYGIGAAAAFFSGPVGWTIIGGSLLKDLVVDNAREEIEEKMFKSNLSTRNNLTESTSETKTRENEDRVRKIRLSNQKRAALAERLDKAVRSDKSQGGKEITADERKLVSELISAFTQMTTAQQKIVLQVDGDVLTEVTLDKLNNPNNSSRLNDILLGKKNNVDSAGRSTLESSNSNTTSAVSQ